MKTSENMYWSDINSISRFSENTEYNKNKDACKTSSILLASAQLYENYTKLIRHSSAYDIASIIVGEANWLQKNEFEEFKDSNGNKITIEVGKVYYIHFGKAFKGELAYLHYGLCIGKRDGKPLIVPMTSGTSFFNTCYHPINNPTANRKFRQALKNEGFHKDCVLLINDFKFISAGRIEKETQIVIPNNILESIQMQAFQVGFCNQHNEYEKKHK